MRPSLRLLLSHPAHFVSLGFGSGLAPRAPGTVGSLLAWALYAFAASLLPAVPVVALATALLLAFAAGCWLIPITARALGQSDPGSIVWDEFVAVWLVLLAAPSQAPVWQAFGVALFRIFDIAKPWPVRWADARFKNGFGVMLDDLLAALQALGLLWLAWALFA